MIKERKRKAGGGRKTIDPSGKKKVFSSATISGTPEEIEKLKEIAKTNGKSVSRYVLDTIARGE